MDLGIRGKWAIVCASSKGLGLACAKQLAEEGVNLVMNARTELALQEAAWKIVDDTGVTIIPVAADITTLEGRAAVLKAPPQVDILVNNAGGPPAGNFRDWNRDTWIKALDGNMLTPIEMIKAVIDPMLDRGWGRIVNITSGAVKSPIEALGLSNGARTGLTGFVAGLSRTTVKKGVTINNILPGFFDTDRVATLLDAAVKSERITREQALKNRLATIPAGRLGRPKEFGQCCAWLCSEQAAFVTGQNILIDGGAYPGTF